MGISLRTIMCERRFRVRSIPKLIYIHFVTTIDQFSVTQSYLHLTCLLVFPSTRTEFNNHRLLNIISPKIYLRHMFLYRKYLLKPKTITHKRGNRKLIKDVSFLSGLIGQWLRGFVLFKTIYMHRQS